MTPTTPAANPLFVAPFESSHPVTRMMIEAWNRRHSMRALTVIDPGVAIEFGSVVERPGSAQNVSPAEQTPAPGQAVQPGATHGSPEITPPTATDRTGGGNPASPDAVPTMTVRPSRTPMLDRMGEVSKGELAVPGTEPKTPGSSAPESPAPVPLAEKPNIEAPGPGERPASTYCGDEK